MIPDFAVIGAGCFGAWTAFNLRQRGQRVILLDAYGAANSRASSGGESRIIRMGYGPGEIYTRWAVRALPLWQEFFAQVRLPLFHRTGVLWLAHDEDDYSRQTLAVFKRLGVPHEKLSRAEIEKRFPQFSLDPGRVAAGADIPTKSVGTSAPPRARDAMPLRPITWAIFEPESGVLLARRAVQAVVKAAIDVGVEYREIQVAAPDQTLPGTPKLSHLTVIPAKAGIYADKTVTARGDTVQAGAFVFACGPWLPQIFPSLVGDLIFPTRQEVFFLGAPPADPRFKAPAMPTWINLGDESYGMPSLDGRGIKMSFDRHGPRFDPDSGSRVPGAESAEKVREYAGMRLPALRNAPVVEARVCQYENTSNGDFLVDRHPDFANVWLVGGGSGHGFKHGPVMGEYVAAQLLDGGPAEPRFALATKARVQHRAVF